MHGPSLATLLVVATLGLAPSSPSGTSDAVAEARRKLARDDGVAAVAILEAALPEAGGGKDALLELLQGAYVVAAKQAQLAGRVQEAETYRENLKILTRKARSAKVVPVATPPPTVEPPSNPVHPIESPPPPFDPSATGPTPLPEGPTPPLSSPAEPEPPASGALPELLERLPSDSSNADAPSSGPSAPPSTPLSAAPDLPAADAAFVAKDYLQAGRIYGALARDKRLPAERRDQWLYCRAFEVVARINARPKDDAEWAGIKAEIEQIRSLNPNNYLGEYLRDLAAERQAGRKKAKPAKAMVVRGSAPEEPATAAPRARTASNVSAPDPSASSTVPASNGAGAASRIGTSAGRWQVLDSANFRIYHADPALASKVAQGAEAARKDLTRRWASKTPRAGWQPLCEIYLYPTAKQYAQMTGQPEDSPGFSTMGMNAGRIISRRLNLRADHPAMVQAVLPHEITHVILADFFTEQQIPRWADEGLAVLSEPADEQQRRAADLLTPLAENRLFAVDALMNMDYPDNRYWTLYYAQSVSLSRFLVEQGTSAQMIQFLQESQREGYEAALRRTYKIDGFPDLQRRWLAYARSKAGPAGVVAGAPATGPDLKVR